MGGFPYPLDFGRRQLLELPRFGAAVTLQNVSELSNQFCGLNVCHLKRCSDSAFGSADRSLLAGGKDRTLPCLGKSDS